ncbi:hypothetical protein FTX61_09295 [Nitriliruptoraceae bacterium ZYF776]|nr:hypothetical protein [Profundirhabdus halotolerans]
MSDQFSGMPGGQGEQPSEEEVRAYLGQLRAAPVEQVVAEVVSALLNAAQVKLGRKDGRLLLDLSAGVVDGAREHLPSEFTSQVDEVLSQLRVAQVEGEREVGQAAEQGHEEPNDLGAARGAASGGADAGPAQAPPASPSPQAPPAPPSQAPPAQGGGKRLWTPGA